MGVEKSAWSARRLLSHAFRLLMAVEKNPVVNFVRPEYVTITFNDDGTLTMMAQLEVHGFYGTKAGGASLHERFMPHDADLNDRYIENMADSFIKMIGLPRDDK